MRCTRRCGVGLLINSAKITRGRRSASGEGATAAEYIERWGTAATMDTTDRKQSEEVAKEMAGLLG